MNLLIVEDNPLILKALTYTFSKTRYNVVCAIDGLQGKELYDKNKPSVVISDLLLPFLNGLELIEHIRETEEQYTKIVVLTSMAMEDSICQAFDLGADDYVVKPFISSELVARVKRLIRYNVS